MFPDPTQIRDIHGIDSVPWWPLAPGWWLVLLALAIVGVLAWRFRASWRLRVPIPMVTLGTWRWDAGRELRALRAAAAERTEKETLAELSELLRRVAMARHGRAACAGLHGDEWLDWLSEHDPSGRDWRHAGRLLIEAPYAPPRSSDARQAEIKRLFDAVQDWITAKLPRAPKPSRTGLLARLRRNPPLDTAGAAR
jgi:hypothetical protein